jgi:hypothetical protein
VSDERDEQQPPDPAGTQPKVDRDALLPARIERAPEPEDEPAAEAPLPAPVGGFASVGEARELHEAPHAARFQFILGALLAIGAIAIVGLIWGVGQTSDPDGPAWSPWKPSGNGLDAAQEIAAHVGPQYKASNGKQLLLVEASELEIGDVRLELVERETADQGGEVARLEGDAVLFRFCGLGEKCAIRGRPSKSRAVLMRREAIEIAGYAFRYLPNIEYTAFFLPPGQLKIDGSGEKDETVTLGNQMLLFRRGDLRPILEAPLRTKLKAPPPSVRNVTKAPELPLIDALSRQGNFYYSLSQSQSDDTAFLVLDRTPQPEQIEAAQEEARLEAALDRATRPKQP